MIRTFSLQRTTGTLDFTWDDVTGDISGPDGGFVAALCQEAEASGGARPPGSGGFKVRDPFHNLGELSAVIAGHAMLTEEMTEALAKLPRLQDKKAGLADKDGKGDVFITE